MLRLILLALLVSGGLVVYHTIDNPQPAVGRGPAEPGAAAVAQQWASAAVQGDWVTVRALMSNDAEATFWPGLYEAVNQQYAFTDAVVEQVQPAGRTTHVEVRFDGLGGPRCTTILIDIQQGTVSTPFGYGPCE
jgi:hypothetical protein